MECIVVLGNPHSLYCFLFSPEIRFSDLVREDSEEDPSPKLILKRQDSLVEESAPPRVRVTSYPSQGTLQFEMNWEFFNSRIIRMVALKNNQQVHVRFRK